MKKKGSAILTVISAIVVLTIMALLFISSSRERAGITKFSSDEKKLESIAESVADLILSYIKKNANNHEDADVNSEIYYLLRAPLKAKNKAISTSGSNIELDVSTTSPIENLDTYVKYSSLLKHSLEEIEWPEDKVTITSKCELVHAESFTPLPQRKCKKVVGINQQHLTAEGTSAKFLDTKISDSSLLSSSESDSDWKPSNWHIMLKFPNVYNQLLEEKVFEMEVDPIDSIFDGTIFDSAFDVSIKLIVRRVPPDDPNSITINISVQLDCDNLNDFLELIGCDSEIDFGDYNVQQKLEEAEFFPTIESMDMNGLKKAVIEGEPNYNFKSYANEIQSSLNNVKSAFSAYNITSDTFDDPLLIEKGAILRITTEVEYNQTESKSLKKTLITEIPFKATDVQPIAPEYSLFIANTPLIDDQSNIKPPGIVTLGEPIDMNADGSNSGTSAEFSAGRFIIHNLPYGSNNKPDYGLVGDANERIPGMVRVNCDYTGKGDTATNVRSYVGAIKEPELTELNQMLTPFKEDEDPNFNIFQTRPSFAWYENGEDKHVRMHEVEFPLLFEDREPGRLIEQRGVKGFIDVYKKGGFDIVTLPTLLYGQGHMEYPLGIRAEGPMNTVYSRICVTANPDVEFVAVNPPNGEHVKDKTEVYYKYEPINTYSDTNTYKFDDTANLPNSSFKPACFGMFNYPSYNPNVPWNSNEDPKYLPANCYDQLQYAKKATEFFDKAKDFNPSGEVELNGVYYVKEKLDLNSFTYKGNALIVSKNNININGNIKRGDSNSTLGIISRTGAIIFNAKEVDAACFSFNPPTSSSGGTLKINGNLVTNAFVRKYLLNVEVFYDNTITSVTPLASLRNAGKFEPKRYYISFADNWSKFMYEKK